MLRVLLQQIVKDSLRVSPIPVEEILLLLAHPFRPFSSTPNRGVEGDVTEQIERIGIRLAGSRPKLVEINSPLFELGNDIGAELGIGPALP